MFVSIVMPCLNEAETIAACIQAAKSGLSSVKLDGEVIIADNGSLDQSQQIAQGMGARVVNIAEKGYGAAIRGGVAAAQGDFIIIGDADASYDFSKIGDFIAKALEGYELVMGCRLPRGCGHISKGAMPWQNRWIGNPILTLIGKILFNVSINDFHCGLRGVNKAAWSRMGLRTTGMEFASEMVIKAALIGLRTTEVPITLYKDGRSRRPHLRPWRDGWRHLRFLLLLSPISLFLIPGLALLLLCGMIGISLLFFSIRIHGIEPSIGTLLVIAMGMQIGLQLCVFALFARTFAIVDGFLPKSRWLSRFYAVFTLEKGIFLALCVVTGGVFVLAYAVWKWNSVGFGSLPYVENLKVIIVAVSLILAGVQIGFSSFLMSMLGIQRNVRALTALGKPIHGGDIMRSRAVQPKQTNT